MSPAPLARSSVAVRRPRPEEVASFYQGYVAAVGDEDVLATLEKSVAQTRALLAPLDERRARHRYAPGKWSVKEVVGHVIDGERVFAYRALRMARGDATPLAAFDQDAYVARGGADQRALGDLLDELGHLRAANLCFFRGLSAEEWERRGTANDCSFLVCAFPWILAGHELHHRQVLVERYLEGP